MMMNKLPLLAAAIAAATTLFAPAALAHDQKGPGKHGGKPMPAFEQIDTNKDGGLTVAELKTGLADRPRMIQKLDKMFKRIDANADGKVQKAEMEAWKARRGQGRHGGKRGPGGADGQH